MRMLKILLGNICVIVFVAVIFLVNKESIYYYPLLFIFSFATTYWIQFAIYLSITRYYKNSDNLIDHPLSPSYKTQYHFLTFLGCYTYLSKENGNKSLRIAFKENELSKLMISLVVAIVCMFSALFIFLPVLMSMPTLLLLKQYELDGILKR